jgi:hypothetical protein
MLRTAHLHPLDTGPWTLGFDPGPLPDQAVSLLPRLLAATRTGLTPASDDELEQKDHPVTSTGHLPFRWAHETSGLAAKNTRHAVPTRLPTSLRDPVHEYLVCECPCRSDREYELPADVPRLDDPVRFGSLLQRIALLHLDPERPSGAEVEQLAQLGGAGLGEQPPHAELAGGRLGLPCDRADPLRVGDQVLGKPAEPPASRPRRARCPRRAGRRRERARPALRRS